MKPLTVRLPDALAAEIEVEARKRGMPQSAVVRERPLRERASPLPPQLADIADLIVDDELPAPQRPHEALSAPVGLWPTTLTTKEPTSLIWRAMRMGSDPQGLTPFREGRVYCTERCGNV